MPNVECRKNDKIVKSEKQVARLAVERTAGKGFPRWKLEVAAATELEREPSELLQRCNFDLP
jgi:hypothetical protein